MFNWFYRFMYGRRGMDRLNAALLIAWMVCAFLNLFIKSNIFYLVSLLFPLVCLYRYLSKDTYRRERENAKFERLWFKIKGWSSLQTLKIKQFKTHRFFKCPACRATIRIQKRVGRVTVRCTHCGHEFKKRILF